MLDGNYSCMFGMIWDNGAANEWRVSIWRSPNRLTGHGIYPLDLPQEVITQVLDTTLTPTDDGVEVELKFAERLVERMFIADYDFQSIGDPIPRTDEPT